jgi:hypothetical protein
VSTLKRNALFILISVVAGLAVAWLVVRLFPGLIQAPPNATAAGISSPAPAAPRPPETEKPVTPAEADPTSPLLRESGPQGSFSAAVRAAAPAVVSVYTSARNARRHRCSTRSSGRSDHGCSRRWVPA